MMNYADRKMTLIITWMAAFTAMFAGLILPFAYFTLSFSYQNAALDTEAEINARIVTSIINANPEMWQYEELRLEDLMQRRPNAGIPEVRRVRDLQNNIIAESAEVLAPPVQTRYADIMDSGRRAGTLEISRSLRPLLQRAAFLALIGALLGAAFFFTLRTIPVRMLRQAVTSLFEEKERAQVTLRSIGDGVITTDGQGRVQLLNGAAELLTGWTQEEARGKPLAVVFHIINEKTRETCENPADRVLREMKTMELANHTVLIARDGTERVIADSGAPIRGADGKINGVVLVFRDVTEKQQLELEMQKAAKLESVGLLAGGIAHDFNNILTAILGYISLARLDTKPEDSIDDRLAGAETACFRARDLTLQLLTFARGGMPVKAMVSLGELIRSSAEFAMTGSNVRPEMIIDDNLPPVVADAGQINQVINNIVLNAVEAMPDGGIITIRAEHVQVAAPDKLPLQEGGYVRISVQDLGPGIPRHLQAKIFDPYFSTKKRGSGLGLATCYSIIKKHDGHIGVLSEPGKGSTFQFYIPTCSSESAPKVLKVADDRIVPGKGRILVMDDEEVIRTIAAEMLSRLGYETIITCDGEEAIGRYCEARNSSKPVDALILDLTVPGRMGGKETIRKLLDIDPNVKAIVSSGYSDSPVMSKFGEYGFCGVMIKPYDMKQMSRLLQTVLKQGQA